MLDVSSVIPFPDILFGEVASEFAQCFHLALLFVVLMIPQWVSPREAVILANLGCSVRKLC